MNTTRKLLDCICRVLAELRIKLALPFLEGFLYIYQVIARYFQFILFVQEKLICLHEK
jgi:hypothetical protein